MEPGSSRTTALTTIVVTGVVVLAVVALVVVTAVRDRLEPHGAGADGGEGGAASVSERREPGRSGAPVARASVPEVVQAVAVLRDWDRARGAAWASGDETALRELYVARSAAGAEDLAMLRTWTARGLRVHNMVMQVFEVRLRQRSDRRLVLVVTDRLAGAVAVRIRGSGRWALPRDQVSTRRLEFRRGDGRWRLASASDRPVARTAATSGKGS